MKCKKCEKEINEGDFEVCEECLNQEQRARYDEEEAMAQMEAEEGARSKEEIEEDNRLAQKYYGM